MKKLLILIIIIFIFPLSSCKFINNIMKNSQTNTIDKNDIPKQTDNNESTTPNIPKSTTETEITSNHEHTFSNYWDYDEIYHFHNATCNHDIKDSMEVHVYDYVISNEKITYTCKICGYQIEYENQINIDSFYGYNYFKDNKPTWKLLYEKMFVEANELTNIKNDISKTIEVDSKTYYYVSEINFSDLGLTKDEAASVWEIFYLENPQFYWLDTHFFNNNSSLFLGINDDYINYSARKAFDDKLNALIKDVTDKISYENTELGKLNAIHDYILNNTEYAYDENNQPENALWAHSIVGFVEKHKGVCESYAKTFIYLSRLFGIENIAVTGSSKNQNHMWNLAKVNNIWYEFDFTWDDNGKTDYGYNYFARSEDDFLIDHVANIQTLGINYLYPLPNISNKSMDLVKLYNQDNYLGLFESIDMALNVTNSLNDYEIQLINYFARKNSSSIDRRVYNLGNINKSFNSLKILGMNNISIIEDGQTKYYSPTKIELIDDVEILNTVIFENVIISSSKNKYLKIKDANLTFKGYVTVDVEIKDDNGTISNDTNIRINYNQNIEITNMNILSKNIHINKNAEIKNLNLTPDNTPVLNFENENASIIIDNIMYSNSTYSKQVVLTIIAKSINSKLEIGNIIKDETSYNYFTINLNIDDINYYPDVIFNNSTVYINYMILSSTLNKNDFNLKRIIKISSENKRKFTLLFGKTPVLESQLIFDEDGYLFLSY